MKSRVTEEELFLFIYGGLRDPEATARIVEELQDAQELDSGTNEANRSHQGKYRLEPVASRCLGRKRGHCAPGSRLASTICYCVQSS